MSDRTKLKIIRYRIKDLKEDFDSGSSAIAENAVRIFFDAVSIGDIVNSPKIIKKITRKLKSAKPAMAVVKNLINYSVKSLQNKRQSESLDSVMRNILSVQNNIRELAKLRAVEYIKKNGYKSIITCSYSSAILRLFYKLNSEINDCHFYVLESKYQKKNYGKAMIRYLKEVSINAKLVTKKNLDKTKLDCGVIGTDAISLTKGVVNGVPSLFMAEKLKVRNIPFLVAGDSLKITKKLKYEKGFDFVPIELITKIMSDKESF